MKPLCTLAGSLVLLLAAAAPAGAQAPEAGALPRGMLGLRVSGIFTLWDERFLGGERVPLGEGLQGAVQPLADRLLGPLLPPFQSGLAGFYAGTQGETGGEQPGADAGAVRARIAGDVRTLPFTLEYGLTRRITVGVTVPVERRGTPVSALYLAGGTVGANPDAATNRAVLEEIDPGYGAFGGGALLPTAGSGAGIELQRRVREITGGDSLELPTRGVSFADLLDVPQLAALLTEEEQAALALTGDRGRYRLGDVQVGARFQLAGAPGPWPPADSLRSVRLSVGARVRLPTGFRPDTLFLLEIPAEAGHFGVGGDVAAEVPVSRRWWVSAAGSLDLLFPADVTRRAFSAARPFPADSAFRTLRREPGPRLLASVSPRYLLTRELSFSGRYELAAVARTTFTGGEEGFTLGPVETATGWTAHRVGLGAAYNTVPAYAAGQAPVPAEVSLAWRATVAGNNLAPAAGSIELTARVYYPLFGRPRRPRPDSAAAPPPAPPGPMPTPPPAPPPTPPGDGWTARGERPAGP